MRQGKWGDSTRAGVSGLRVFDKDKIQAGFDITSQFINQAGTFVANRAAEADAAKAAANNPNLTPDQRAAAQQRADELNSNWGPSGTYRQVLTALSVAAGGNVTGGVGQLAQSATVAYLQELGANQVKQIADNLGSEEARVALHAIVGCAGAAASSQSCGAGAMGAASSSVLGSLLAPSANLSATEREARDNLVTSLVAGVAAVSGQNIATAAGAGKIEVENNQVAYPQAPPPPWLSGFKLPGYKGETAGKGDGVIADPVTELDPSIKPGSLISPMPDARTIGDWITSIIPDQAKGLVNYVITAVGGKNNRLPIPEVVTADNGLQVESNPKHTPGMPGNRANAGTEPSNSLDLFNSSIPGDGDKRYAIDSNGNINRFYSDGNGVYHWSGSTGDASVPIDVSSIPIVVKRLLGFKGK